MSVRLALLGSPLLRGKATWQRAAWKRRDEIDCLSSVFPELGGIIGPSESVVRVDWQGGLQRGVGWMEMRSRRLFQKHDSVSLSVSLLMLLPSLVTFSDAFKMIFMVCSGENTQAAQL